MATDTCTVEPSLTGLLLLVVQAVVGIQISPGSTHRTAASNCSINDLSPPRNSRDLVWCRSLTHILDIRPGICSYLIPHLVSIHLLHPQIPPLTRGKTTPARSAWIPPSTVCSWSAATWSRAQSAASNSQNVPCVDSTSSGRCTSFAPRG